MTEKITMHADEIETTINYSKYHIGDWAEIYTTDKNAMLRYERFANKYPDYCKLIKEDKYSMTFSVHPKCAGIYLKAPRHRTYTEEQLQEIRERLAKTRKPKNA